MRIACSALLIAGATLFAGSSGAIAAPASGGAIKAAADEIGVGESVHCRPYRHPHRWGFGRGCYGPSVRIYERGPRFRHRFGVREEFRGGYRHRDRAGVTIRGEDRGRGGATFRSGGRDGGSVRGSATFRSGGAGDVSPRGSRGGQAGAATNNTGGGQMNATGGRQMNTAPTGNTGRSQGGGSQGGQQHGGGSQQGGAPQGGSQQKQ